MDFHGGHYVYYECQSSKKRKDPEFHMKRFGTKDCPQRRWTEKEIEQFVGPRVATEMEVATAKRQSTLTLPGRWETARAVARDIAALVRFKLPDDYWNDYADLVDRLTVGEVDAAAKRLLHPDRLTWVVVGDRKAIEADVRALGFGEVTIVDADGNPVPPP